MPCSDTSGGFLADPVSQRNPIGQQFDIWKTNFNLFTCFPCFVQRFLVLFTCCRGFSDMLSFMKRPRYRRKSEEPRVEVPLWVRIMSRRVESSVSHAWNCGFVTWKYVFRFEVN